PVCPPPYQPQRGSWIHRWRAQARGAGARGRRTAQTAPAIQLMRSIRYSRFTGDDFGLSAEDLLRALSDFFLESGFQNQYMGFSEWNQHTLEGLEDALPHA